METKNLTITLPKEIWKIITNNLNDIGTTESEIIQNIIISFLLFRNYFLNSNKLHDYTDIYDNIQVLDYMITSTVEILEEKNIISDNEWKERMERKVMK